jgi:hypothetical protein
MTGEASSPFWLRIDRLEHKASRVVDGTSSFLRGVHTHVRVGQRMGVHHLLRLRLLTVKLLIALNHRLCGILSLSLRRYTEWHSLVLLRFLTVPAHLGLVCEVVGLPLRRVLCIRVNKAWVILALCKLIDVIHKGVTVVLNRTPLLAILSEFPILGKDVWMEILHKLRRAGAALGAEGSSLRILERVRMQLVHSVRKHANLS